MNEEIIEFENWKKNMLKHNNEHAFIIGEACRRLH